jgi:hypothetical protein
MLIMDADLAALYQKRAIHTIRPRQQDATGGVAIASYDLYIAPKAFNIDLGNTPWCKTSNEDAVHCCATGWS